MNKLKNPMFWIGIVSAIFLAANIDPETLTQWNLVLEALLEILLNPVKLVAAFIAVYSMWNDNSTKKLDIPFKKK